MVCCIEIVYIQETISCILNWSPSNIPPFEYLCLWCTIPYNHNEILVLNLFRSLNLPWFSLSSRIGSKMIVQFSMQYFSLQWNSLALGRSFRSNDSFCWPPTKEIVILLNFNWSLLKHFNLSWNEKLSPKMSVLK